MMMDHSSKILIPDYHPFFLQSFGAISFPIFGYSIFKGFYRSQHFTRYLINVLLCALLSQSIYSSLFFGYNAIWSLLLGLVFLYLKKRYCKKVYAGVLPFVLYGIASPEIFIIFIFDAFQDDSKRLIFYTCLFFVGLSICVNQFFYLFSPLVLFLFFLPEIKIHLHKYFFYLFYPIHLYIIAWLLPFFKI